VVQTACTTASNPLAQTLFVRVAGADEPADYTFSGPGPTGAVGSVLSYTGVDAAQPIHASAGAITRNSKGLTTSLTTTSTPTLLVGAFTHSGRSSITPPSGMTARTDALTGTSSPNARMLTADQLLPEAGTQSRTARAQAQNTCNVAQLVALNAAPDPPVSTAPPVVTGTALEEQVLTATSGSWSGSPTSYAYAWERCDPSGASCVPVPDATDSSYRLAAADVGHTLRVAVTASNSGGSTTATSSPTPVVAPIAPPANVAPPAISGTPREGETLVATTGAWSGSPTAFAYQWERCAADGSGCTPLPGADETAYVLDVSDAGSTVRVLVTASNSAGASTASSAPTPVVLPLPPRSTSPPLVTGEARLGETLTATPGSWSGTPTSVGYEWQRCEADGAACVGIGGAVAEAYAPGNEDLGRRLRVVVTAANAGGSTPAASEPTAVVLPRPPSNLTAPTISGIAREGEPLNADPGTWSSSPTSYAYLWQRSGDGGQTWDDLSASSVEYVPTGPDVGSVVRVVVTASNAGGSEAAASAPTGSIVPAVAPESLVAPTISGTAQDGVELTASTGTWTGSPTAYGYQWERCQEDGETCSPIADAVGSRYTPGAADVGARLRVAISATNAGGTGYAASVATSAVLRAAPRSTAPPIVSGTPLEGANLTVTTGEWSGDPSGYAYLWHRCAADGSSCTAVTWADASSYRLRAEDVGLRIRVQVTASNEGGPASAMSEPTGVVVPLPPANETLPVVSGVLEEGEVVSATPGGWRSSAALSYAYRWQASADAGGTWADISDADAPSYLLTGAEVGSVVRVVVTATNAGGSSEAASDATAAISSPGRPVNTAPPTYSGFVQAGRTVTAVPGSWSGTPSSYSYQWQRSNDGGQTWSDAVDATAATYSQSVLDIGLDLRVQVTASNDFGSAVAVSPWTSIHPAGDLVATANQQWRCNTSVDLDLAKVTLWTRAADAVVLGNGCTGRIGRVEVDTWTADALKTANSSTNAAHDLVIESGVAICHARLPGYHQDGWQSLGGARITVRNFVWACGDLADPFGSGVAQAVVIARAGAGVTTPTDTVVEHSVLMPGAAHSVAVGESLRSGVRNSVVCPDRTGLVPFTNLGGAADFVYEAIDEAPVSDPRCASLVEALAWAQG
jgi:hypothetical protein